MTEIEPSSEFTKASKQQQSNARERRRIDSALEVLGSFQLDAESLKARATEQKPFLLTEDASSNLGLLQKRQAELHKSLGVISVEANSLIRSIGDTRAIAERIRAELSEVHAKQATEFARLQQQHQAADERSRIYLELEQRLAELEEVEAERTVKKQELDALLESRKSLKSKFLTEREQVSALRESVSAQLQREAGKKVRIRVLRNADDLSYRTLLIEGLKGARVRNHDEILQSLLQLRPEQLAQFIQTDDAVAFDEACGFGHERARKILDAFREHVDPLELEVVEIEDRVRIELNVATSEEPIFKDAAELSRGQKCTALLPLLLAPTTH